MLTRRFLIASTAVRVISSGNAQTQSKRQYPKPSQPEDGPSVKPKDGFVPNEQTAVRIAEAILILIYGEKSVRSERPFRTALANGIWTVGGTLPPNFLGGTAVVRLAKPDGRVLSVIHGA